MNAEPTPMSEAELETVGVRWARERGWDLRQWPDVALRLGELVLYEDEGQLLDYLGQALLWFGVTPDPPAGERPAWLAVPADRRTP